MLLDIRQAVLHNWGSVAEIVVPMSPVAGRIRLADRMQAEEPADYTGMPAVVEKPGSGQAVAKADSCSQTVLGKAERSIGMDQSDTAVGVVPA